MNLSLRLVPTKLSLLLTLVAIMTGVRAANLDDHLNYAWQEWYSTPASRDKTVWLPGFRADNQGVAIHGVENNASGITYDHDRESLWVVVNNPPALVELDLDFTVRRQVELAGFRDTEGVAYCGEGVLAIIEERSGYLVMAQTTRNTVKLERQSLPAHQVYAADGENNGLEGLAVRDACETVFAAQEDNTKSLYRLNGTSATARFARSDDLLVFNARMDDLSGMHFDAGSGHLLILSDESRALAEIDLQGNLVSRMVLQSGLGGLNHSIAQAEGVALDGQGRLYIVGEPNLIYRFSPEHHFR